MSPRYVKVLIALGGVVVLFLLLAYAFWPQAMGMYLARKLQRDNPAISSTPVPLVVDAVNDSPGQRISRFGWRFEVPWTGAERLNENDSLVRMSFATGHVVFVYSPAAQVDHLATLRQGGGTETVGLFGEDATASNYAFLKATLNSRPEQVTWSMSRREAARAIILLNLKSIEMSGATDLYSIELDHLRGYQFVTPVGRARNVELRLYGEDDRPVVIRLGVMAGSHAQLTQADVNRVLTTLRPDRSGDRAK